MKTQITTHGRKATMFWGVGDSSKLQPEERQTLDALRRLGETGHIVGLTPEQTKVAIAAIQFYASVTATSGIIAGARNVLLFIGSICVMYWAVKDFAVQFVKTSVGG
jgi:hypothetical protein